MLFSFTNVNGTNVPDWKCAKKNEKIYWKQFQCTDAG